MESRGEHTRSSATPSVVIPGCAVEPVSRAMLRRCDQLERPQTHTVLTHIRPSAPIQASYGASWSSPLIFGQRMVLRRPMGMRRLKRKRFGLPGGGVSIVVVRQLPPHCLTASDPPGPISRGYRRLSSSSCPRPPQEMHLQTHAAYHRDRKPAGTRRSAAHTACGLWVCRCWEARGAE